MARIRKSSKQTIAVLKALLNDYPAWSYGYELAKQAQLKSGTLYPILMRLSDRDFLASKWEESPQAGRPPRHMYRLTASGIHFAEEQISMTNETRQHSSPAAAGDSVMTRSPVRLLIEGAAGAGFNNNAGAPHSLGPGHAE